MAKVDFELNWDGVRELMQSPEMVNVCKQYAEKIRNKAGSGYEISTHVGKTRANASVIAVSHKAKNDCLKNNTLLKALRG